MPFRETHVLHRYLNTLPPRAVAGQGPYLIDVDGKRYLDGSGGAAVSCLGHGHPDVLAAMHQQITSWPMPTPVSSPQSLLNSWRIF